MIHVQLISHQRDHWVTVHKVTASQYQMLASQHSNILGKYELRNGDTLHYVGIADCLANVSMTDIIFTYEEILSVNATSYQPVEVVNHA